MSERSFFMPGGLRSFTRGGKEKPGNPGAIGKKVKSTLVLIILKKYFCFFFLCLFVLFFVFFYLMFCQEIIIGLFAWFCFILSTGNLPSHAADSAFVLSP